MAVKVAINGFGRIGRLAFRQSCLEQRDMRLLAINEFDIPKRCCTTC